MAKLVSVVKLLLVLSHGQACQCGEALAGPLMAKLLLKEDFQLTRRSKLKILKNSPWWHKD